ncbi:MAG: hypothetical protein H0Z33_15055 [Bacillaceae bacterium]|nr:hypothetical protein [Bacillaceae bacterium]
MHLIVAGFSVFAVWKWGDWLNWQKYHTTMLYFALCNVLYNVLVGDNYLWRFRADVFSNNLYPDLVYTLIVFPATTLLFLGHDPGTLSKRLIHILKWISLYVILEWVLLQFGRIEYQHGWNLLWSACFDSIMFPMLWLHHKRPLTAYLLSFPIALFFITYFDIPIESPTDNRKS